jgi:putative mRNA 3-end processing factor
MARDPILTFTNKGIYCPDGDFHIDPGRAVPRALVTHGHSDHAARGHDSYLCTEAALPVIRHRLGRIAAEGLAYGERRQIGGVTVSFHPAGHVPGSAQIRIERGGEVWVVSGDYKVEPDGLCEPFAPLRCDTFISECTFGLPIFRWRPEAEVLAEIAAWWAGNAAQGRISVLAAYSFGKAQRLMAGIPPLGPIFTHPVVEDVTDILREQGYPLPRTHRIAGDPVPRDALVIAPPNALSNDWAHPLSPYATGFASGWMALSARRKAVESAFTLSDHADWPGLNAAIRDTGAEQVFVTHGYTEPFRRWLESQGYDAGIVP